MLAKIHLECDFKNRLLVVTAHFATNLERTDSCNCKAANFCTCLVAVSGAGAAMMQFTARTCGQRFIFYITLFGKK
jgi:hypothetical protein